MLYRIPSGIIHKMQYRVEYPLCMIPPAYITLYPFRKLVLSSAARCPHSRKTQRFDSTERAKLSELLQMAHFG